MPVVFLYVDPTLAGAASALARLTSQSRAQLARRAIHEMLEGREVPSVFGLGAGDKTEKLHVYLPQEMKERLAARARELGVSVSSLASGALARHVTTLLARDREHLDAEIARRRSERAQHADV